jgi:hypothetical protein
MDGGTHMLMNCPGTEGLRTERHHETARLIFRAIARGRKGGYLTMVDIGSKDKREEDSLQHIEGSIPDWIFPYKVQNNKEQLRILKRKYKPDGLLIQQPDGPLKTIRTKVHIVEFKYCQDTNHKDQQHRAENQHQELYEMLRAQMYTVEIVTLLIGVGGAIYKDTIENLTKLGVEDRQLQTLLTKMNLMTAKWMDTFRNVRLKENG